MIDYTIVFRTDEPLTDGVQKAFQSGHGSFSKVSDRTYSLSDTHGPTWMTLLPGIVLTYIAATTGMQLEHIQMRAFRMEVVDTTDG